METNSQARQVRMILYVTCLPLPNPKPIQCVRWDLQPIMVALSSRASLYQHVSLSNCHLSLETCSMSLTSMQIFQCTFISPTHDNYLGFISWQCSRNVNPSNIQLEVWVLYVYDKALIERQLMHNNKHFMGVSLIYLYCVLLE